MNYTFHHSSRVYVLGLAIALTAATFTGCFQTQPNQPNILWITSEDNGRYLGCYGDPNARTPNLDALATKGIRYTQTYANAPVCAPARNSWIFATHASSLGTHHMRSKYLVPREQFSTYPELFNQAGYYTTNNSKTDYNTHSIDVQEIWDECSREAHYQNRPEGSPFFAIFNLKTSHESQIFPANWQDREPKTPAAPLQIPPYQLAIPEVVSDWQRYYDQLEIMDARVGELLAELEASGEAENTIIAYCSDHAGVMLRSKRYLHDSGTRVPFILYFPEKWQHLAPDKPGTVSDRLVQFIDMPKTWLSLAGITPAPTMNGHVFAGDQKEAEPESIYLFSGRFDESPDTSRAVTDGRWKLIRNFEPDRPRFQTLTFPLRQDGQYHHWIAHLDGKTNETQAAHYQAQPAIELYDTLEDPHEVNNLAQQRSDIVEKMSGQMRDHALATHDLGFLPEPLMESINNAQQETIYQYGQSASHYPLADIYDLAVKASMQDPANEPTFYSKLEHENITIRHWSAVGLRLLASKNIGSIPELKQILTDPSPTVSIPAAVALGYLGEKEAAVSFLLKSAQAAQYDIATSWALDGLKLLNQTEAVADIPAETLDKGKYSARIVEILNACGSSWQMPARTPQP